jgi:type 1 fimbriae regulatory protein FimB/type 1 fimbriae regulatory protein FimE
MTAAKSNRNGHRDAAMILIAYRGLRAAELVDLQWSQIDLPPQRSTSGESKRARRPRLLCAATKRERCPSYTAIARRRHSSLLASAAPKMIERAGVAAGVDFKAHPHVVPHARLRLGQRRP